MATYSETLTENVGLRSSYGATQVVTPVSDGLVLGSSFGIVQGSSHTETIHLVETRLEFQYIAGAIVNELFKLHGTPTSTAVFRATVQQVIKFLSTLSPTRAVALHETFHLSDAQHVAYAINLIQKLAFSGVPSAQQALNVSLIQGVIFNDALYHFFGGQLSELVHLSDSFVAVGAYARTLNSGINLSATPLASTLFMRVINDTLNISDEDFVQAIFKQTIDESFVIQAAWVDPGTGEFTTWAINTRTGAVTEYQNFVFNSFAKIGSNYYGANNDGLWLLNSETDNGANIVGDMAGGFLQLGGSRYTQLDGVYLGMRVDTNSTNFILKIVTPGTQEWPDGATYVYQFNPKNMRTTKVDIGKGLRTRYLSWELITPGPDFDLDSIEFVPVISQRRV